MENYDESWKEKSVFLSFPRSAWERRLGTLQVPMNCSHAERGNKESGNKRTFSSRRHGGLRPTTSR